MFKKFSFLPVLFALLKSSMSMSQPTSTSAVVTPRMRVIVDNDFSGDPDGLFQLVHLLMSPSVEIRAIIGSHLRVGDGFDRSTKQADNAAKKAREVLQVMDVKKNIPVFAGSNEYSHKGRPIRVYTHVDTNLMFNDFFAKLELINP